MKFNSILETVGNTPLVRLNKLGPEGVNVWVKVEAFNPMGSVKDRMALAMIEVAEKGILWLKCTVQGKSTHGSTPERGINAHLAGAQLAVRLDEALRPFLHASAVRMDLRQMFLEILVEAAFSSGSVSAEESVVLQKVAMRMGRKMSVGSAAPSWAR